jgi:hypothetical protein
MRGTNLSLPTLHNSDTQGQLVLYVTALGFLPFFLSMGH